MTLRSGGPALPLIALLALAFLEVLNHPSAAQQQGALHEVPYELKLQEYLRLRTGGGPSDPEAYFRAAEHVSRMPPARFDASGRLAPGRPGIARQELTAPRPRWEYVGPTNLDVPYRQYWGPRPVAGRVNAVAYHPTNPEVIFAGSAAGGLFRSNDAGKTWIPLSDPRTQDGEMVSPGWPDLHVSAIAIDPIHPDTIYAGLGDFQGRLRQAAGGIMRSKDGGTTWTNLGVAEFGRTAVSHILLDPEEPNILIVTTSTGVWRSTSGGDSWNPAGVIPAIWSGAALGAFDPVAGNRAYYVAGSVPQPSKPQEPPPLGAAVLMRSTDKGVTWIPLAPPSVGGNDVFAVAASPVDPNAVYALLPRSRIISRSSDRGGKWQSITNGFPRGENGYNWSQPAFDYFIACGRRGGKDLLYVGLIDLAMSTDAGDTWTSMTIGNIRGR